MSEPWWLYLIECKGGGIYVGITKNVENRYLRHVQGKGSTYTKLNPPQTLLGKIKFQSHAEAFSFERSLKKLPHLEKLRWAHALRKSIIVEENITEP